MMTPKFCGLVKTLRASIIKSNNCAVLIGDGSSLEVKPKGF